MYGWTDPMDPNGAPRRAERPTDEPDWLRDRPEPRSAYLFGDDPDQPGDEWHRAEPTARWQPAPVEAPTTGWPGHDRDDEPTDGRRGDAQPTETADGWRAETDAYTTGGGTTEVAGDGRTGSGRHRSPRNWRRPLMIGGAAAAATLVVSVGVGALAMPGGNGPGDAPTAVDETIAAAPAVPSDPATVDTLVAPSPTSSPSPTRPSPSPSRVVKPTPASSRTTAASRRSADRSTAPSTTSGGGASGTVSDQAREVVDLVNAERAKAGCKALSIDDKLMTAAQRHSQDQADHSKMSHTGSDGSDTGVRLDRVGYAWRTYGENVAWNQKTPAAVMDAWMNSSGHRANILNCAFTEIGVGIASSNGPYWTQVFAAPR
ncbi:CAP domain-containing protein [Micromonospora sp. DT4]|uniref:CAP domain-containing protein n=1 Tax=Micromonospora sp. DT4 TaxID=3393438 RepID=UPI003CF0B157